MSTSASRSWAVNSARDFGATLAGVRRARGLTQQQLSELTGVERTYLAKLERGAGRTEELTRIVLALRRMGAELTVTLPDAHHAPEA